jgi:hypothetical protein
MLILTAEYSGVLLVQGAILGRERVTLRPWFPSPRIQPEAPSALEFSKSAKEFILTTYPAHPSSTRILRHDQLIVLAPSPASKIGSPRSYTR